MRTLVLLLLVVVSASAAEHPPVAPIAWQPIGLSGGGAMFAPAISPLDGRVMMLNCDMSGAYLTRDGGATWRMIDHAQLRSNISCRPAFHPTDAKTIFAAGGWNGGLMASHDAGTTWSPIPGITGALRGEISICASEPALMLVGVEDGAWRSRDGGATWTRCAGPVGAAVAFGWNRRADPPGSIAYAATAKGVWRSLDAGATWEPIVDGLPSTELRSFTVAAERGEAQLYCAIPSTVVAGAYSGGVFHAVDLAGAPVRWASAMGKGINVETKAFDQWAMGPIAQYHWVLACDRQPRRVYAFNANTGIPPPHQTAVFRSDDAGATWRPTFFPDPRYPGCNLQRDYTVATDKQFYQDVPGGVAIDPRDADHLLQVDGGRCHLTADGGKTWTCGHTVAKPGSSDEWLCNGLVVTTTWHHYVDPSDALRRFICYTDIGFASSRDAGASWRWWQLAGRAPWGNTCYELAFDPQVPGKVWGAFSEVHDIPNGNIVWGNHSDAAAGGVCVSLDHCDTWAATSDGLPKAPVTSIVLDPTSPPTARVLYAAVFNHGVFRSKDGGAHWEERSVGLGSDEDRRVTRVLLHRDGTLFAAVTARRVDKQFVASGPGLYRSSDQGEHWQLIPGSNVSLWPKDVTVDPADSRDIWFGACDTSGAQTGGLYRTRDGGGTWKRVAREGHEHFGAYLHPHRKGWVYMTLTEGAPGAGLWLSVDDGATWTAMSGLPFANAQRVEFDPKDDDVIYVTTFGGSVWRGPAREAKP